MTLEFLGTWESIYNPNFKVVEFDHFKKESHSTYADAQKQIEDKGKKKTSIV
jgi:hypothetical protein